ncbi:MAG: recombinase family protein [Pseudobutyrivibrio sp.]|nr:recombinase family protein [Pseudobutyrivibrio sp.]
MTNKAQKCYIYTRVSTELQVEGYSLEAQKERLIKEAAHRGMKVCGEYSDEGKSGKNITGRPEFQKMLKDIQSRKDAIDYVLVFKLSRFGRNAADTLSSLQIMQDYGVNLLCVEDQIDSAGPAGKLIISVLAAVAEIERENIKAQTMAGRLQKAREGYWNGGFAPNGYKLDNGELVIVPEEADIVRLIFNKFVSEDIGAGRLVKWLNENGYQKNVHKNGTLTKFSVSFVKGMIDNPVYAGFIAYGRRKTEKIEGTRNEYHVLWQDNYEVFEGKHEAIIDRDTWTKAQAKRELTGFKQEKRFSKNHAHILSGIVRCPKCGGPMYGAVNRKKKKGSDDEFYTDMWYYTCKNTKGVNGHDCDFNKHIRQDDLNSEVISIVKLALKDMDFESEVFNKIGTSDNLDELKKSLERLKKGKASAETKKDKILAKIMALDALDDTYDIMYESLSGVLKEIAGDIKEYDDNIDKTMIAIANANGKQLSAEKMMAIMRTIIQTIDMAPDEDQRVIMNFLLDRIDLKFEKEDGKWVKSIRFKIPINIGGKLFDTVELGDANDVKNSLPNESHDETVVLLTRTEGTTSEG